MDFEIEEEEISRLKEILFPKKTQMNSRFSQQTLPVRGKENSLYNQTYNIKSQIDKLKRGIEMFMEKQSQTILIGDQTLVTPRQCLQLIREMSENLQNPFQEIEEAVTVLLESFPKLSMKAPNNTRYFYQIIKFKLLGSKVNKIRHRILGESFDLLKAINKLQKEEDQRIKQQNNDHEYRKRRYFQIKLSSAFNIWRRNAFEQKKIEIEKEIHENPIMRMNRSIPLLQNQGKLLLWLQQQIQSNADICQILIYNSKSGTLRGYIESQDHLGSVFETIETSQNQIQQQNSMKVKRIQFCLEHSLSKICITKKQCLRINNIKTDLDYRNLDDMISVHGNSTRETVFGCILTPLSCSNGQPIGIIREYYYNGLGVPLTEEMVFKVSEILENCVRTSSLFEQIKQKSRAVRQNYYLKGIQILNFMADPTHSLNQLAQSFNPMLQSNFNFTEIKEYPYEIMSERMEGLKVELVSSENEGNYEEVISALQKMIKTGNKSIIYLNNLFIRTNQTIYRLTSELPIQPNTHISQIIVKILEQRQKIVLQKQLKETKKKQIEEIKEKISQKEKLTQTKSLIQEFCRELIEESSIESMMEKIARFINCEIMEISQESQEYYIDYRNNKEDENGVILMESMENSLVIKNKSNKVRQLFPEYLLESLRKSVELAYHKIMKPIIPSLFNSLHIRQLFWASLNYQKDPDAILKEIVQKYINIETPQIAHIEDNPFEQQNYLCYTHNTIDTKGLPQQLTKFLRKYTFDEIPSLMKQRPKHTIICLAGNTLVVLPQYYSLQSVDIIELARIYSSLTLVNKNKQISSIGSQKNTNAMKIYHCLLRKYEKIVKSVLQRVKIMTKKKVINFQMFHQYVYRQQKQMIAYSFKKLTYKPTKKLTDLNNCALLLSTITKIHLKTQNVHLFFEKMSSYSQSANKLRKAYYLLSNKLNKILEHSFTAIFQSSAIIKPQFCYIFHKITNKIYSNAFQKILRFSWSEYFKHETRQTEIAKISKMVSLSVLTKYLGSNYSQYRLIIDESYTEPSYIVLQDQSFRKVYNLQDLNMTEDSFQFPCKIQKNGLKSVIWQNLSITQTSISLTDKHYFKVLSKGIEECYIKYKKRSENFLYFLHKFSSNKMISNCSDSFEKLLAFYDEQVRTQQYQSRKQFYEFSIEAESLRLIDHETKKEINQRQRQIKEVKSEIEQWEENTGVYRKKIVRLDLQNKKLDQKQLRDNIQLNQLELKRLFMIWRKRSIAYKKNQIEKKMRQKSTEFPTKVILKAIKRLYRKNQRMGFNGIVQKAASQLAQLSSLQSKIQSIKQKQTKIAIKDNENYNENGRLMTFQDQLNYSQEQNDITPQKKASHDVSIIPISFKHFQLTGSKQNVQVTDEELKKINNGVYKLNPKTVKFLKRMGKINSEQKVL